MGVEDTKHFLSGIRQQLLCVATVCNRFTFLGVTDDMSAYLENLKREMQT